MPGPGRRGHGAAKRGTDPHARDFLWRPRVHGHGAHKAGLDAESAVRARALKAHKDAIRDGGPLGLPGGAVHTDLRHRL